MSELEGRLGSESTLGLELALAAESDARARHY